MRKTATAENILKALFFAGETVLTVKVFTVELRGAHSDISTVSITEKLKY
jgi:hypothetical protein